MIVPPGPKSQSIDDAVRPAPGEFARRANPHAFRAPRELLRVN